MIGEWGDALSFGNYAGSLRQAAAMDPEAFGMVNMAVLGGLTAGALLLLILMVVRRSGTAAAGFALLTLFALSVAMLFGSLDFLTAGTRVLIGSLTASALVLFVNAVLHTGRENLLVAGLSAVLIGLVLTLGGLTAMGMDYAGEARVGMMAAAAFAALTLIFALFKASLSRSFLGFCVFAGLISGAMMLDQGSSMLVGSTMVMMPLIVTSTALLLACITAPFLADDVRMGGGSDLHAGAFGAAAAPGPLFHGLDMDRDGMAPAPLFAADDAGAMGAVTADGQRGHDDRSLQPPEVDAAPHAFDPPTLNEAAAPSLAPLAEPAPADYSQERDPVSNDWGAGAATALDTEADEYVWDALASLPVRCGGHVLEAFGLADPSALTPEGLRERLAPEVLADFDQQILGGGEPVSGRFDVELRTDRASFRFDGRRQVDHDGILMRLDGRVSALEVAPQPAPSFAATAAHQTATPMMRRMPVAAVDTQTVVRLGDQKTIGFDASPPKPLGDANAAKALIDAVGAQLAHLVGVEPKLGPFAMVDATAIGARAGVIAGAVGKAVRVHDLPKRALVIGLDPLKLGDPSALQRAVDDIHTAGGGVALVLRDPHDKIPKIKPDMVWVDVVDAGFQRRQRKSVIEQLRRRFGVPVVVRDIRHAPDAAAAEEHGASFAAGPYFVDEQSPATSMPSFRGGHSNGEPSNQHGTNPHRSLRSQGLR